MMAPQKTQPKNSNLTPLLLLVVSGFLVFLAAEQDRQGKPQRLNVREALSTEYLSELPPQYELNSQVNRHLFLTDQKIYWEQQRQHLENLNSQYEVSALSGDTPSRDLQNSELDFEADARERHLLSDLNRDRKKIENYLSPQSKIQSQVLEDLTLLRNQEQMRREYAEQFVKNARAGGYEVVLDQNYNIKSVKPIRNDRSRLPGAIMARPNGAQ